MFLEDGADLLTVAQYVANRAVWALGRLLYRMLVGTCENMLLLDHETVGFGQLVDSVQLHSTLQQSLGR